MPREYRRPIRTGPREMVGTKFRDGMRSWDEVALIWRMRSGEAMTRQGVCYVAHAAVRKLRRAIENDPALAFELGLRPDPEPDPEPDQENL